MKTIELMVSDFDDSGLGLPTTVAFLPAYEGKMVGAYVFRTDGVEEVGHDYSGNENHADVSAATLGDGENCLILGTGIMSGVTLPFTADDLFALSKEISLVVVATAPAAAYLLGDLHGSIRSIQLVVASNNNGQATAADGATSEGGTGTNHVYLTNGVADPERANRYELWVATFKQLDVAPEAAPMAEVSIYRKWTSDPTVAMMANTWSGQKTLGGSRPMKMGVASLTGNFPVSHKSAAAAIITKVLTPSEIQSVLWPSLKSYLASGEITLL